MITRGSGSEGGQDETEEIQGGRELREVNRLEIMKEASGRVNIIVRNKTVINHQEFGRKQEAASIIGDYYTGGGTEKLLSRTEPRTGVASMRGVKKGKKPNQQDWHQHPYRYIQGRRELGKMCKGIVRGR